MRKNLDQAERKKRIAKRVHRKRKWPPSVRCPSTYPRKRQPDPGVQKYSATSLGDAANAEPPLTGTDRPLQAEIGNRHFIFEVCKAVTGVAPGIELGWNQYCLLRKYRRQKWRSFH